MPADPADEAGPLAEPAPVSPMAGLPELRRAIADKLAARNGIDVDPDGVVTVRNASRWKLSPAIARIVVSGGPLGEHRLHRVVEVPHGVHAMCRRDEFRFGRATDLAPGNHMQLHH